MAGIVVYGWGKKVEPEAHKKFRGYLWATSVISERFWSVIQGQPSKGLHMILRFRF